MNKKEIKLISVKLYTEYYKNNIEDRYIRNYSDNVVIDNDVLKADYLEYVYITTLDKHNKLQQENKQLKDNWNKLKEIAKSQSDFKLKIRNKELWFEIDELLSKMQEFEGSNDILKEVK